MSARNISIFAASLSLVTCSTYILTRSYYHQPVVHLSRRLAFYVSDIRSTIDSPFEQDVTKSAITAILSTAIRENAPKLDSPGIQVDTSVLICKNGKEISSQRVRSLFLRRVSEDSFQFWDRRQFLGGEDWILLKGHAPGPLASCVDYYWKAYLGDLVRDFNLDWYVEHPPVDRSMGAPRITIAELFTLGDQVPIPSILLATPYPPAAAMLASRVSVGSEVAAAGLAVAGLALFWFRSTNGVSVRLAVASLGAAGLGLILMLVALSCDSDYAMNKDDLRALVLWWGTPTLLAVAAFCLSRYGRYRGHAYPSDSTGSN